MKDKKLIVKIFVPIAIVAVIVGIWLIKNIPEKEEIADNQSPAGQENYWVLPQNYGILCLVY